MLVCAETTRELRRRGELIGTNDPWWIGCAALRVGLPVLTANVADFQRIDGLGSRGLPVSPRASP